MPKGGKKKRGMLSTEELLVRVHQMRSTVEQLAERLRVAEDQLAASAAQATAWIEGRMHTALEATGHFADAKRATAAPPRGATPSGPAARAKRSAKTSSSSARTSTGRRRTAARTAAAGSAGGAARASTGRGGAGTRTRSASASSAAKRTTRASGSTATRRGATPTRTRTGSGAAVTARKATGRVGARGPRAGRGPGAAGSRTTPTAAS